MRDEKHIDKDPLKHTHDPLRRSTKRLININKHLPASGWYFHSTFGAPNDLIDALPRLPPSSRHEVVAHGGTSSTTAPRRGASRLRGSGGDFAAFAGRRTSKLFLLTSSEPTQVYLNANYQLRKL